MCEQLVKYDCGHLYRRTLRCAKQQHEQHKRYNSVTCFSSQSPPNEELCHEAKQLERRATLCPKCEMQCKDGDVYVNSTQRASLPTTETRQGSKPSHGEEKREVARVSTSARFRRIHSDPTLLPSQRLRRVRATGSSSLRNEYIRLENPRDNSIKAQSIQGAGKSSLHDKYTHVESSRDNGFEARRSQDTNDSSRHSQHTRLEVQDTGNNSLCNERTRLKSPQHHDLKARCSQDTGDSSLRNEYIRLEPPQGSAHHSQDTSNSSLRNHYTRLKRTPNNGFEAHRDQKPRPRDLIMPEPGLDWYASSYIPMQVRTPSSGNSFTELLRPSQSRSDQSRTPSIGIICPETKVKKRLQKKKSLYHQTASSNESFVCSRAREVEKGES